MRDGVNGQRGPRSGTAEEGWALIEALMAAVVLAIVVLGVYSALNASTHAAGFDRQRSTASALAEQDLERLRGISAAGFNQDFPPLYKDADGNEVAQTDPKARYKVESSAIWVQDDTGAEENCSDTDSDQGTYLKIASTVTPMAGPTAGATAAPVTMTSLMAPNAAMSQGRGTLAVRVTGSTGAALPNVQVTLDSGAARATNAAGCAVFGYIPVGSYSAQVPSTLVDKSGTPGGAVTADVTENTVNTVDLQVDTPAALDVTVQTKLQNGDVVTDKSDGIIAANSEVPTGYRQFTLNPATGSRRLTSLFPFANGYTVYSGTCLSADPARENPDYYTNEPGVVDLGPGATGSVTVREPAVNVEVVKNGQPVSGAHIVATNTAADCGGVARSYTSGADGGLPAGNVGLPFGHYTICASVGTRWWNTISKTVDADNEDPDGTGTVKVDLSDNPDTGSCPS